MKRLEWLKAEMKKTEDSLSAELNSNQPCGVIYLAAGTFKFAHVLILKNNKCILYISDWVYRV